MKIKNITYILAIVSLAVLNSCSDFLDVTPDDKITGDNFYLSEEDYKAATAPLYNIVWFDFNDKFYYGLGDGRGYNLLAPYSDYIYPYNDLSETGITSTLTLAWQSLYNVVQQANKVILGVSASTAEDDDVKNKYIAEARFIRGTAYWYITSLWGNVIINEDPNQLVNNPIVNTAPQEDVFEFVMRDLEFAAKYLPEQATQSGRVTKYSAFGMLSRIYLSRAGLSANPNSGTRDQAYLDLAKKAAEKVINESGLVLKENYADLFMVENNNNSESLFSLQWVPNNTFFVGNSQQRFFAPDSKITGGNAWGGATTATYDILSKYESSDLRRIATWMGYNDYYPEIDKANGGYTFDNSQTAVHVKKGVVGSTADNPLVTDQNSALNTYMMRLAEVYLNYAEAVLGNSDATTDATALELVNRLRRRANVSAKTQLTYANLALERRIELCMEGQYWYDLLRRSYYQQQEVINYLIGQNRQEVVPYLFDGPTNSVTVDPERTPGTRAIGSIDANTFLLPLPESEVVQNPKLKDAPVPYEFTEERITDLF